MESIRLAIERLLAPVFDITRARAVAVALFTIALIVRLVGLALEPNAHLSANARESIIHGAELIRAGEFLRNPDYPLMVPPLVAMIMAGLQTVFGHGLLSTKILQILLDAATVVIVFLVGRRAFPYWTAVIAAAALTLYPFTVFVPLYIGTEAFFTFFLAGCVLAYVGGVDIVAPGRLFWSGLLLGLATLARGTTLYFPVCLLGLLFWRHRQRLGSAVIGGALAFVLGFCVVVGPWAARNLVVLHAFIPTSIPGLPLLLGSSEDFWIIGPRQKTLPQYFDYLAREKGIVVPPRPSWPEKDRFYKAAAMERYKERWRERPWSFAPFVARKFLRLWYGTESGNNELLVLIPNLPIYLLGILGLWASVRRPTVGVQTLVVLLGYFVVLHVAVFAYFRYLAPAMPFVLLFAAHGAAQFLRSPPTVAVSPKA